MTKKYESFIPLSLSHVPRRATTKTPVESGVRIWRESDWKPNELALQILIKTGNQAVSVGLSYDDARQIANTLLEAVNN
jgi:hypothetical protein